ncbi:MAG TPA: hypothetical protein VHQ24_07415, partial [Lachnospiraceae bacterium]|nr:hypothetical protein [Lachnospiraceae bacterium]
MKGLRNVLYETRRLFLVRKTWVYMLVITFVPILFSANLFGIGGNYYGTMTSVLVLGPAKGAVFVAVCASLFLTLLEMQRMTKYRMNIIIETMTNPIQNQLRQTVAILIVTATSVLLSLCILIPYTMHTMGSTFRLVPFLACWIFIYFGGALIAILFSSGLFMITRSFDASFIIMGVLIGISFFAPFGSNYLLLWVQTNVLQFSDATQSYLKIDVISYTRLVWLLASLGIYMLGLSCIRRYGRNLIWSFLLSCRKVVSPILFAVFVVGTVITVKYEPYFDNGPVIKYSKKIDPDTGIVIYETDDASFSVDDSWNDVVTVQSEHAKMSVDTEKRVLKGEATYNISNPSGEEQD